MDPTSGVNLGGTTINTRLSNWAKIGLPISVVSFQTANGLVLSEKKDVLKINTPKITMWGVTDVFIIGSLTTLAFRFRFVPPCNYNTFCSAKGLVVNCISVDSNPPQQADNACSEMYCIDPNLIPYPSFVGANPSLGIISGGTIVTVRAQGFAATRLSNVEIQVGFHVGNPMSLSKVGNAFDESILIFAMPTSPQGAITQDVEVKIRFGAVRRSLRFLFQYIRPLVGNPVVSKIVPSSVYQSQALTYLVELTNFPQITLQQIALISIEYGNSRKTVERIVESSAETTVATFSLPANALNVGRHSLRIFYTPAHPN